MEATQSRTKVRRDTKLRLSRRCLAAVQKYQSKTPSWIEQYDTRTNYAFTTVFTNIDQQAHTEMFDITDRDNCFLPTEDRLVEWLISPIGPCPICDRDFNMSDHFPVRLVCDHYFYNDCLCEWALAERNNSCFMDRCRQFFEEESEEELGSDDDGYYNTENDDDEDRALGTGETWRNMLVDDTPERICISKAYGRHFSFYGEIAEITLLSKIRNAFEGWLYTACIYGHVPCCW
jgi:hypothetical protein